MFTEVLYRVAFLIAVSLLGWYVGKKFKINSKDISSLLIYVFTPAACFILIYESPATVGYVVYTFVFYIGASIAALIAFAIGKLVWKDSRANLFGAVGGAGNVGYFVLPLAIGLLKGTQYGAVAIAIVVFVKVASNIYEFTTAFYLTARGKNSIVDSLILVMRMPTLYASALALILKHFNITLSPVVISGMDTFVGGYSVLGMMIIGLSLAKYEKLILDWKFIGLALLWKHVLYTVAVIVIFSLCFHLSQPEKIVVIMIACNPLASNISAVATLLNVHPEKAACAIMASTLLAVITVPFTISLALKLI